MYSKYALNFTWRKFGFGSEDGDMRFWPGPNRNGWENLHRQLGTAIFEEIYSLKRHKVMESKQKGYW